MHRRARVAATLAVSGALLVSACARNVARPSAHRYELNGRVVSIDTSSGRATVAHKAIPGYMDAMTMEIQVEPPSAVATLTPGDRIRATLVVDDEHTWIEYIERLEGTDAGFDVDDARDPDIGALVPPFELTDQNGRRFGPERFRGRAVLVSFIYTRCPLPDYCARMTANFDEVARTLESRPLGRQTPWSLLSISIDPEHDSPAVLRDYAAAEAPSSGSFERWTFATGSPDEVRAVARFFGLSYETQSGQIVHSLRTILVGRDGKVAAIFRGNAWTVDDAVAAIASTEEHR